MRKTARVDFTKVEGTFEEGQRRFPVVATAVAPPSHRLRHRFPISQTTPIRLENQDEREIRRHWL